MKNMILSLFLAILTISSVSHAANLEDDEAVTGGSLQNAFSSWGSPSLEGDWKIVKDRGAYFIELGENFRAKKGPDVKIFLSPTPANQVTGKNAVNGSVFVTQIHDFDGSARIAIPEGTDVSQFQSLVFHCEEFSKLWGSSALH